MMRLKGVLSYLSLVMGLPVSANTPTDGPVEPFPTIVITPEWRAVDLQQMPSTVNVLSGQQLEAGAVQGIEGLQYRIPGMLFRSTGGAGSAYLRGVGGAVAPGGDAAVATFVDGAYQAHVVNASRDFYDVEHVEVIKGPHGVHLGRNVVGGAVSVITRDPLPYRDAYADILYGSDNQRQIRAAVNTPIGDTDWFFRLAGTLKKRDGYSENVYRDEDVDDQDYTAWRGKLRYRPSGKLDVIFSAEHSRQDDSNGLAKQPDPDIGVNGGILLGGTVPDNPRKVTHNLSDNQNADTDQYITRVSWRPSDWELRSTTVYQQAALDTLEDLDGTEVDFSSTENDFNSSSISQEFRLASRQDRSLAWVAGVFFMQKDASQRASIRLPLTGIETRSDSDLDSSAYGLFGELSWLLAPRWRGRAGLRYSYDESEIDLEQTLFDPFGVRGPAGTSSARFEDEKDWDAITPEFGLTFDPDRNRLYYAKASRGFKSGGFNAYAAQPSYAPEYLWAYEAGFKVTLPAQQLRLNAALFYYDYDDIQLFTLPPGAPAGTTPVVTNAARARVRGLDLQAWYQPMARLQLTAGATLLDGEFDEFDSVDPNNPTDDPDRSGDSLPQSPDVSLTLVGEYRWQVARHGDLRLSADYRYQSQVYFNPYNDNAVRQHAYSLYNASMGYYSHKEKWYAELYGNNLTDETYAQNIVRLDPALGTSRLWGEPRTFGLRLGYRL